MNVSREWLDRAAAETGFQAPALERVVRLGEVLADITRHPFLGPALALKGGTALNLGFGAPPRLSVDLDLNYVASPAREDMLRDRPVVERAVERLVLAADPRPADPREDFTAGSSSCSTGTTAALPTGSRST